MCRRRVSSAAPEQSGHIRSPSYRREMPVQRSKNDDLHLRVLPAFQIREMRWSAASFQVPYHPPEYRQSRSGIRFSATRILFSDILGAVPADCPEVQNRSPLQFSYFGSAYGTRGFSQPEDHPALLNGYRGRVLGISELWSRRSSALPRRSADFPAVPRERGYRPRPYP